MTKQVLKRHVLGGFVYLLISFIFVGLTYNTAYPHLAGNMSLFFLWTGCYHAFLHFLNRALIKFFPELVTND